MFNQHELNGFDLYAEWEEPQIPKWAAWYIKIICQSYGRIPIGYLPMDLIEEGVEYCTFWRDKEEFLHLRAYNRTPKLNIYIEEEEDELF